MIGIQIARFTAAAALAATLLMLVPGVALAWVLARRRFPGKAVVEALVSLPARHPSGGDRPRPAVAAGRRGPVRTPARAARGRNRLHAAGRRHRDGGHGAAAARAHGATRLRAGHAPVPSRLREASAPGRGACLRRSRSRLPRATSSPAPCSAFRAPSGSSAPPSWSPEHSRSHTNARRRHLHLRGDRAGRGGGNPRGHLGRDWLWCGADLEPAASGWSRKRQ